MVGKRGSLFVAFAVLALICLGAGRSAFAVTDKTLYRFNGTYGEGPVAGLVFDSVGNLYGTTSDGGPFGVGTVFELTPGVNGTWSYKMIHGFNGTDGRYPSAGLVLDSAGNLYGTTAAAGPAGRELGNVFELISGADGKWTEKVLHNFSGSDGSEPVSGLVFDASGDLYGTTFSGGGFGKGCVFELIPGSNGKWSEKVLHAFQSNGTDGAAPRAGVIFDESGNLYGTTFDGGKLFDNCGSSGCGTVFELSPGSNGFWSETILFTFQPNTTGRNPDGGVIFDTSGNLYGTTSGSGPANVFSLSPGANGTWTEKVLYSVGGGVTSSLIFDSAGNLYGTNDEVAFELKPDADGQWKESILHTFSQSNGGGGIDPQSSLIFDSVGNLYGTATKGGNLNDCVSQPGCGVIFKLTP
jgi:uncharacterized repeat protein (TIGR03803 family)